MSGRASDERAEGSTEPATLAGTWICNNALLRPLIGWSC